MTHTAQTPYTVRVKLERILLALTLLTAPFAASADPVVGAAPARTTAPAPAPAPTTNALCPECI